MAETHGKGGRDGGPIPTMEGYVELVEIGRGGMGVVYRAMQIRPWRPVALKMLRGVETAGAVERLVTEAEAVATLHHPNIVQIYEASEHDGRPFFTMELVEGGSLDRELRDGPIPARRAARIVLAIARAVQHAHERGILHRDLKPANVLLAPSADPLGEPIPKVSDFGLAKRLDEDSGPTQAGEILGTPAYMSPEQAGSGEVPVGAASDVYGLGVILYELLTGRVPFRGSDPIQTLFLVRTGEPVPPRRLNPKLPRDLETVCLKCLEKDPARRYPSAEALAEDIRRHLDDQSILARPASAPERAWKWTRRRPTAAASIGLVLLAATALVIGGAIYNAQLRLALARTQKAEKAAGLSARDASRQRDLALSALRSLVFEVQKTLRDEPATRGMRKALLDRAIAGLRDLAKGAEDASPDLGRLSAHREMGEIFQQLGETAEARRQYESCLLLAADLIERGEVRAGADVAPVERHLGELELNADRLIQAEGHFRKALKAAEAEVRDNPGTSAARLEVLETRLAQARATIWGHKGKAAIPELTAVCDLAREAAAAMPGRPEFAMTLAGALLKLGDLSAEAAEPDRARKYYVEAASIARKRFDGDPRDWEAADIIMVAQNGQADLAFKRSDFDEAEGLFARNVAIGEAQAQADPEGIQPQLRVVETCTNLAILTRQRRRFTEAADWAARALGRLEKLKAAGKLDDLPVFRDDRIHFLTRMVAFCRAVPTTLGDDGLARTLSAGHSTHLTAELLLARTYDRAKRNDGPGACESVEAMARLDTGDFDELYELTAIGSASLGSIQDPDEGPRYAPAAKSREIGVRALVDRLNRLIDRGFKDRDRLATDPRFRAAANFPEYQAVVARIAKPAG